MSDSPELEAAALQAREARARLASTAQQLQARLVPARLLDEAVESARSGAADLVQTTAEAARRRPRVAIAAVAAGVALLVHRPLWRLGRRLVRGKETE